MIVLSWLYGIMVWLRNLLFDCGLLPQETLPGKVISIGNIAVGGTGKSPMIVAVAEHLCDKGARPVILTRGYRGGLRRGEWLVLKAGARIAGTACDSARPDEAIMESKLLPEVPVIVGANRRHNARRWLKLMNEQNETPPTHWLLDDGFQHRSIRRDLDVVLLDAAKPFGTLLPKGRFREPTESLGRAHAAVFTRSKMPTSPRTGDRAYLALIAPELRVGFSEMTFAPPQCVWLPDHSLACAWNQSVYLVSGIAQPQDFRRSAESLGIQVLGAWNAADHAPMDFKQITEMVERKPAVILMTEKDWARCEPDARLCAFPIFVLPMRASLPPELLALL